MVLKSGSVRVVSFSFTLDINEYGKTSTERSYTACGVFVVSASKNYFLCCNHVVDLSVARAADDRIIDDAERGF